MGVDLEVLRPSPAHHAIARRFFAPEEIRDIEAAPPGEFTAGFIACWVRKEACLKAVGAGLALPMKEVVVPTRPTAGPPFHIELHQPEGLRHWTGHDLAGLRGLAASLVVEGHGLHVRLWEWA